MELGVDISALNAVYMRNMPPTPANYAQRSGRAGRSGQAALVITYCAAQSPHDQYYFGRPREMVSGIVRPPALDLANRDLVEAHLHAVWLADSARPLEADIPHVLDLKKPGLAVQQEISDVFADPELTVRSAQSMRRILESIDAELTPAAAPWAADRAKFADHKLYESSLSFDLIQRAKEYAPRYRRETQQGDQCCSRRSFDGSADCKLWLHGVCKFVRRVRQVHRRGHSEMGQGGEVRGHQAGLIRADIAGSQSVPRRYRIPPCFRTWRSDPRGSCLEVAMSSSIE
jgi:hypothetical protein